MGILSVLSRKAEVIDEPIVEEQIEQEPEPTGPYLAVLEPDVAGISSFRLRFFPRAGQAEDFVATLRPDARRGTHAFWAMHDRPTPQEGMHVEALVLVRANEYSDVVYVVSFLDIESAHSFTRFEVKRGLSLGNVLIYWAAFTQLREELDCVSILPTTAPMPMIDGVAPAIAAAPVVAQAEAAVDRYVEQESIVPEYKVPVIEDSVAVAEPPIEVTAPEPVQPIVEEQAGVTELAIEDEEPIESIIPEFFQAEGIVAGEEAESIIPELSLPVIEENVAVAEPPVETPIPEAPVEPDVEIPAVFADPDEASLEEAYVFRHTESPFEETQPDAGAPSPGEEESLAAVAYVRPLADPFTDSAIDPVERENACYAEVTEGTAAMESTVEIAAEIGAATEEAVLVEPSTVAIQEMAVGHSLRTEGADAGMIVDAGEAPAGAVISFGGDDEFERREPTLAELLPPEGSVVTSREAQPLPEASVAVAEHEPLADDTEQPAFDAEREVQRLLRNRRWESRNSPFDGFNSPPGRF